MNKKVAIIILMFVLVSCSNDEKVSDIDQSAINGTTKIEIITNKEVVNEKENETIVKRQKEKEKIELLKYKNEALSIIDKEYLVFKNNKMDILENNFLKYKEIKMKNIKKYWNEQDIKNELIKLEEEYNKNKKLELVKLENDYNEGIQIESDKFNIN